MTDTTSKILPNSFQTPNFFVDECMSLLNGNEYKCLSFVARKTFGWQKRSDRISKSQIMAATGLGHEAVDKTMSALVKFGLVLRLSENNSRNNGAEWALQTDDAGVRFDLLQARQTLQAETNHRRTTMARLKQPAQKVGMSDIPPAEDLGEDVGQGGGGDVAHPDPRDVGHPPQKPTKAKENMGTDAPASPVEKTTQEPAPETPGDAVKNPLEVRITAFPMEYQETVRLMLDLFGVRPPEKPEPGQKGGDYALWLKGIRDLLKLIDEYNIPLEKAMRLTFERWRDRTFDVSHPGALKKTMTSLLAQVSRQKNSKSKLEMPQETTQTEPGAVPSDELQARMEVLRNRRKTQNQG